MYVLHLKLLHCNNPGNNCLSFSLQYILIKWYLVDVEMLLLSYTMLVSLLFNMSLTAAQITIDCLQLNFTSSVSKINPIPFYQLFPIAYLSMLYEIIYDFLDISWNPISNQTIQYSGTFIQYDNRFFIIQSKQLNYFHSTMDFDLCDSSLR